MSKFSPYLIDIINTEGEKDIIAEMQQLNMACAEGSYVGKECFCPSETFNLPTNSTGKNYC